MKIKHFTALFLSLTLCVLMLAACSSTSSSVSSSDSQTSSQSSASQSSDSQDDTTTGADAQNLDALVANIAAAADLGTTIDFDEIDVYAQFGVNKDDFVAFAGVYSQTVSENGGEVMLIQAAEGKADAVKSALESYQSVAAGNEDYAEFENARQNVKKARIAAYGDIVIYAVNAAGTDDGWKALDDAIAATLG